MDWGEATRIAGGGFGIVIMVLIGLAIAVWLMSLVLRNIDKEGDED